MIVCPTRTQVIKIKILVGRFGPSGSFHATMSLESVMKAAQIKNLTVDFLELRPFSSEIFPDEK